MPTRHSPKSRTYTDRTFFPFKLNDCTTECWTKGDILFVVSFCQKILYIQSPDTEFCNRKKSKLNAITSIHSTNQDVLEYPQNDASILHAQKLYRVRPANSTEHDYLVLVQLDLVDAHFCSRQGLLPIFFDLHVFHQADIKYFRQYGFF